MRDGFRWVDAWYDAGGVYHGGYWEPVVDRPEHVWIPGWFDGVAWIAGYWVPVREYEAVDPTAWEPDEGWDDGWQAPDEDPDRPEDEPPLAIPAGPDQ